MICNALEVRSSHDNSPNAHLLEHKLELARLCLLDPDWTVAETAYDIGYSPSAHPAHAFRTQYGVCPNDLRGR